MRLSSRARATARGNRSRTMKQSTLLLAVSLTAGCATTIEDVHHFEDQSLQRDLTMITSSTQLIIRNPNGTVCVGPPPDAGSDLAYGASVSIVSSGSGGGSAGDDEMSLGGRNPNVLITRDIFFQGCLAEARLELSKAERRKLFGQILDAVTKINAQSLEGAGISSDVDVGASQTGLAIPQDGASGS
ncbi:MAG: hypothetical protein AAGE01_02670 [Pseudomonadota bacterium]